MSNVILGPVLKGRKFTIVDSWFWINEIGLEVFF